MTDDKPSSKARLKKRLVTLERRLEKVEQRLQSLIETNELWDGS